MADVLSAWHRCNTLRPSGLRPRTVRSDTDFSRVATRILADVRLPFDGLKPSAGAHLEQDGEQFQRLVAR